MKAGSCHMRREKIISPDEAGGGLRGKCSGGRPRDAEEIKRLIATGQKLAKAFSDTPPWTLPVQASPPIRAKHHMWPLTPTEPIQFVETAFQSGIIEFKLVPYSFSPQSKGTRQKIFKYHANRHSNKTKAKDFCSIYFSC